MPKKKEEASSWEWKDDAGTWSEYKPADAAMLEAHYKDQGPNAVFTTKEFSFNSVHQTLYEIDFAQMTQTNAETKATRWMVSAPPQCTNTRYSH